MIIDKLKQLGLNSGEAELYAYLIENGDSPVSEIASEISIGRTNIYEYARSLKDRGLITDYEKQRKIYYHAESPINLKKEVEKTVQEAQSLNSIFMELLPKLEELYLAHTDLLQVKYFMGDEGHRKVNNRIYMEGIDDRLMILINNLDKYEPPEPRYRSYIQNRQLITYLYSNQKELVIEFNKRDEKEQRITLDSPFKIREDMIIYENVIYVGSMLKSDFKMAMIENANLAEMLRILLLPK